MTTLVIIGPVVALLAVVLGVAALGWDPLLRRLTRPAAPLTSFQFTPNLIAPAVLLALLLGVTALLAVVVALTRSVLLALATPLVLAAWYAALQTALRWRYQLRLRRQVILAVTQLAAMTRGSAGIFAAFRTVGRAADRPLRDEWAWVEAHLNVPLPGGAGELLVSDHATALRALADQTPLDLHAQVIDHLAAVYENGVESQAGTRLQQLADVLAQQSALQTQLQSKLGKVQGEAYVIVLVMVGIMTLLMVTQWERVYQAFVVSPYGPFALVWVIGWGVVPLVAAYLLTRAPELPL